MEKVLVTNGILSKALAVVRSLGQRDVHVIVAEKIRFHPAGLSKYAYKSLLSPDASQKPDEYFEWLSTIIRQENCSMVIPTDDDTMRVVVEHQDEIRKLCAVLVPPKESYDIADDKRLTMRLAHDLGIPAPVTVEYEFTDEIDEQELLARADHLLYPVLIKPRVSSGSRGVRVVENREQLVEQFKRVHLAYPNPLIQERIPDGPKFDTCLCMDGSGRLVASFVQRQVRNYPIHRGPSTVHKSVARPDLVEYARKMLESLRWIGVADVEFMEDPRDGVPKLMEINPRLWSSVHLAVRCGVDFPHLLYRLAKNEQVEPVTKYLLDYQGRALLPGDILHFIENPNRRNMSPSFWRHLPDDILSKEDPLPTLGFFMAALRYAFSLKMWKFLIRR